MWWYEEIDETQFLYDQERREERNRIIVSLLLAFLCYALFLFLLFVQILRTEREGRLLPRGNELFEALPRRATPARVLSLPAPTPSAPGTAAPAPQQVPAPAAAAPQPKRPRAVQKPLQQKPTAQPSAPTPPQAAPPEPARPEPALPEPALPGPAPLPTELPAAELPAKTGAKAPREPVVPLPANAERKGGIERPPMPEPSAPEVPVPQPLTPKATPPEPAAPLPTRAGRSSWIKKSAPQQTRSTPQPAPYREAPGPQAQPTAGGTTEPEAFGALEDISARQATQVQAYDGPGGTEPTYGSPMGSQTPASAARSARNMEFELFATRLVHNICDASRQNPLRLAHTSVPLHYITILVTVARNRSISRVEFLHPSPEPAINRYLEEILKSTMAPQLPASWHSDELSMPLHIHIRSVPERAEIWLVPIDGT
ncbi:MAG: hypothetical protein M1549_00080 [Candidatus Dependentiae bacterium]|nr:hypothetical protein [Candidatus Dependentiae bacterium]